MRNYILILVMGLVCLVLKPIKAQNLIWHEAEQASISLPMEVESNSGASCGRYVVSTSNENSLDNPPLNGNLVFTIDITEQNTYCIWARVKITSVFKNSFWVSTDLKQWEIWENIPQSFNWVWHQIIIKGQDTKWLTEFTAGENKISFAYRNSGAMIDKILVTSDLNYQPVGAGEGEFLQGPFYLSSSMGNDSNAGNSPESPLQTIEMLNKISKYFVAGTDIYLHSGDTLRGQLNIEHSGLPDDYSMISTYGGEAKAIISGAEKLSNWTNYNDNIYRTQYDGKFKAFYANNKLIQLARYPNNGFLHISNVNGKSGFSSDELDFADDSWVGGNVRFRSVDWAWENNIIKSYNQNVIEFENQSEYQSVGGWGFYLDGLLIGLDTINECAYSNTTNDVYFWPKNVSQLDDVEVSVYGYGINVQNDEKYLHIENLHFDKQAISSILLNSSQSNNITIADNEFSYCWSIAIQFFADKLIIKDNYFHDLHSNTTYGFGSEETVVENNIIKRLGLIPGYGRTGQHSQNGIKFDWSNNCLIRNNNIDSTGYCGIVIYGENNIIENNIVNHAMQILDDGGGIYVFGNYSKNGIIRNNYVLNSSGSSLGKPGKPANAQGIYLDNKVNEFEVSNNIVVGCNSGILVNAEAKNNRIIGNTCYGSDIGISFSDWGVERITGCTADSNLLFALNKKSKPFDILFGLPWNVSKFRNNRYYNPYDSIFTFPGGVSFNDWVDRIGDVGSRLCFYYQEESTEEKSKLFVNTSDTNQLIVLDGNYVDMENVPIDSFILKPFTSKIIINADDLILVSEQEPNSIKLDLKGGINFNVYPNPILRGDDIIISHHSVIDHFNVTIFSSSGDVVYYEELQSVESFQLNTQVLKQGVYILQIKSKNQKSVSKLIVL